MRKFTKYFFRALLILIGLIAVIIVLIYLSPVQKLIKNQAISYVSESFGIKLSVDRLRLKFPLKLAINNTTVITNDKDTLFHCNALEADVAFFPLLRSDVW